MQDARRLLTAHIGDPVRIPDTRNVRSQHPRILRRNQNPRHADGVLGVSAVHRDLQHVAVGVRGHVGQVGALIERVRHGEACPRAAVRAAAGGLRQPVHGAAEVAPHQHIGSARSSVVPGGASKKLWPAANSAGLSRSNSFAAGLPPRSACTATDTETGPSGNWLPEPSMSTPKPSSSYPSVSGPVVKPWESTLLVPPGRGVAVVGLAEVLDHCGERFAEDGHQRRVACEAVAAVAVEGHPGRRRRVHRSGRGAGVAAQGDAAHPVDGVDVLEELV